MTVPAGAGEPVAPNPPPTVPGETVPARQSDDPAVLASKLTLALDDKRRMGETNASLNARLLELQAQLDTLKGNAQPGSGADDGFKGLWEQAKQTAKTVSDELATVKTQLKAMETTAEQEKLSAKAIAKIASAEVVNAEQLLALLANKIRKDAEGNPVVLHGGVEHELGAYLATLRQPESGFAHHFLPSGQRGMGAMQSVPAGNSAGAGTTNPYLTGNLTAQVALEATNPAMAKTLEGEALQIMQAQQAAQQAAMAPR